MQHRYLDLGDGVTIHVAEAGPEDGPPVMLVHGSRRTGGNGDAISRRWPPTATGCCVPICGGGRVELDSAGGDHYFKNDLADDLAGVVDRLGVGPVRLVAHDWGGPVATIFMLRHPEKVASFMGINTAVPWLKRDLTALANIWRMWYQIPMMLPVIGPRVIADPKMRFFRLLGSWVGGDFETPAGGHGFLPGVHVAAGVRPGRLEVVPHLPDPGGGAVDARRIRPVPRHGAGALAARHRGFGADPPGTAAGAARTLLELRPRLVPGAGHWIIEERPELVLDRLRTFLTLGADAGKPA